MQLRSKGTVALVILTLSAGLAIGQSPPPLSNVPPTAATQSAEERDLLKALEPMDSPDPIQRVLATETNLRSEDHLLRSLALEKALGSSDGRVRQTGLIYLLDVQKQFIIDVDVTKQNVGNIHNADGWLLQHTFKMSIRNVNKQTLVFDGMLETGTNCYGNDISGLIGRTGLTMKTNVCGSDCRMTLNGSTGAELRGALTCGPSSFPISTPLM
jgi:hypothetical protein